MLFNIVTFSLFWVAYRYNTLYVTVFRFDTGGLLFPKAINQLFTGLYVMELCLIGLFFLVRDPDNSGVPCQGQAIIMIIVFIATVIYQWLLNQAFSPLFRYLPITLEDDAVVRDEEFARAQQKHFALVDGERNGDGDEDEDINRVLADRERRSEDEDRAATDNVEMRDLDGSKARFPLRHLTPSKTWADRSRNRRSATLTRELQLSSPTSPTDTSRAAPPATKPNTDLERQSPANDDDDDALPTGAALFADLADEMEDLTPAARDKLVQRAFQHAALRAKRPVIWIPRDDLGVSDDEIYRCQRLTRHLWISNEYTGLDGKARVVYRRSPPDFSEVDLIRL